MTYYPVVNAGDGLAAREGPADGESVLWLHAYGLDSSSWSELWDLLPGWHHVGVDLPGHGLSLPLSHDSDLSMVARRIAAVAEKHRARHVVGLSFGTLVALQMAIEAPEAYDTLVLGSPLVGEGANDDPFWKRYRELVNMFGMAGHGEFLRGRLMLVEPSPFDGLSAHKERWDRVWEIVGRHSFLDLADAALVRLGGFPQSDVRIHGIRAAALMVAGKSEHLGSRRHAERLSRVLPDCRTLHMLGAGAHALLERPDQAAAAIDSHLRSRPPAPPSPAGGAA